jgi:hypothetical protein
MVERHFLREDPMKTNTQFFGAVLAVLGTLLLAKRLSNNRKLNKELATKRLAKEAAQSWEGEGGAVVVRRSRS